MKKNMIFCMLLMLVSACGGDSAGGDDTLSKDYLNVTPNMVLQKDGDTKDLQISANCNWTITIMNNANWLTVNPMSGSNSQTVTITAGNNSGSERVAVLSIKGGSLPEKKVTITQWGTSESENPDNPDTPTEYSLSANKSSLDFENTGGSQSFNVTSNTNWTITAPSWCTVSPSSGNNNASVTVTASENPNAEQRSGQIAINGDGANTVYINVSQKAKESGNNNQEPGSGDNLPPS